MVAERILSSSQVQHGAAWALQALKRVDLAILAVLWAYSRAMGVFKVFSAISGGFFGLVLKFRARLWRLSIWKFARV